MLLKHDRRTARRSTQVLGAVFGITARTIPWVLRPAVFVALFFLISQAWIPLAYLASLLLDGQPVGPDGSTIWIIVTEFAIPGIIAALAYGIARDHIGIALHIRPWVLGVGATTLWLLLMYLASEWRGTTGLLHDRTPLRILAIGLTFSVFVCVGTWADFRVRGAAPNEALERSRGAAS